MPDYFRDFAGKAFKDFDLEDVIYCHLSCREVVTAQDFLIRSTLQEMRDNMRHAHINNATKNFTPLLCAFSILDQLAGCYRYTNVSPHPLRTNNREYAAILRALYYFMNIPPLSAEAHALYALRNTMMHDAAFVGQNLSKDWYFFRYDHTMTDFIQLPKKPWDGNAKKISPATTTLVNPRRFTDLVDSAIDKLFEAFVSDRSSVQNLQIQSDIRHKFLAWIGRPAEKC